MGIDKIIEGHVGFKENMYELHEKEFLRLMKEGQQPNALFISCSDSRVVPELITQSPPGTLFHQRQVGNFIPPYNEEAEGMHTSTLASIEFAIHSLKIKDIIICGHSNCGACAGLYQDLDHNPELKYLSAWINQSPKLKGFVEHQKEKGKKQEFLEEITEKVSLLCQLENLLSYPLVSKRAENKEIFIHVWYYNIAQGNIEYHNPKTMEFENLSEIMNGEK